MGYDLSVTQKHVTGTHFPLNEALVYLTLKQNLTKYFLSNHHHLESSLLNFDSLSEIKYICCDLYLIAIVTSDLLALILFLFFVNLNL